MKVSVDAYPSCTPLIVQIPVTISALPEDIIIPKIKTKQSPVAWALLGIFVVVFFVVGFGAGIYF